MQVKVWQTADTLMIDCNGSMLDQAPTVEDAGIMAAFARGGQGKEKRGGNLGICR